jgi:hypothetical protein
MKPGNWLFISHVCKEGVVRAAGSHTAASELPQATIRLTAYGTVFQSPQGLLLACEHGLQALFATDLLQQKAGAWCHVLTLLAAQELGLQVTDTYARFAAVSGNLVVLKILHTDQGVQLPADVSRLVLPV